MKSRTMLLAASLAALASTPALAGKDNDTFVWATSTEMDTPDIYYGNQREALMQNTEAKQDGLFLVPQVID